MRRRGALVVPLVLACRCSSSCRSSRSTSRACCPARSTRPGRSSSSPSASHSRGWRSRTTCSSATRASSRSGTRCTSRSGVYVPAIALTEWEWSLPARARAAGRASRSPCRSCSASVSLRVSGIAFAMVTLAFAQAGNVIVQTNPGGLTGGDEGFVLNVDPLPDFLVGVRQHEEPVLGRARLRRRRVPRRPRRDRIVRRSRLACDPGQRAPRRGDRAPPVPVQAPRRSCSRRSSRPGAGSSGCC